MAYPPIYSGAATQAQRLYAALVKDGFQITVLTAHFGEAKTCPQFEIIDGVQVYRLPILPNLSSNIPLFNRVWRWGRDLSFSINCITKILKNRSNIDLIQIQYSANAALAFLLLVIHWLNIPVIVRLTMLKPTMDTTPRLIYPYLERWAFKYINKVIALSTTMANQFIKGLAPEQLEIIHQGIDTTVFHPILQHERVLLRQQLHLDQQAIYVIFVGIIYSRKGVDILIQAFVDAAIHCANLKLILVGQYNFDNYPVPTERMRLNQYYADLMSVLKEHQLTARVLWTGNLPQKDVALYLQAADIFCFPSRLEGVPSSLLEAMACGLPVIASSLQGTTSEIISYGKEGFVVKDENTNDYAMLIQRLAYNRELSREMGHHSSQRIQKEFSFNISVKRYKSLFFELIKNE